MQEIVWLLKNNCDFKSAGATILDERSLFLEMDFPDKLANEKQMSLKSPLLIKTHLGHSLLSDAISKGDPKVIVVMRNPKDVLVSQFNFYRANKAYGEFTGTFDEFFLMFKNKELCFGYWIDYILSWWRNRGNPNYLFVKYEDMKKMPTETVIKVAKFLNTPISKEQIEELVHYTQFDNMKKNDKVNKSEAYYLFDNAKYEFMRKGIVGDWRNIFSKEQSDFVDSICEELKTKGLIFDFE